MKTSYKWVGQENAARKKTRFIDRFMTVYKSLSTSDMKIGNQTRPNQSRLGQVTCLIRPIATPMCANCKHIQSGLNLDPASIKKLASGPKSRPIYF